MWRCTLVMTAWASSGVPSENLTSGRSARFHVVPLSGESIDFAMNGTALPSGGVSFISES